MIAEFKMPKEGRVYSKELLKKAVEEYSQVKDKGLVCLTHGERTGCVDLDFRSLYTDIKEVDISNQVLGAIMSERWNNHRKDKSVDDDKERTNVENSAGNLSHPSDI